MVVNSKGNPRLFQKNPGWLIIIIWPDTLPLSHALTES